MSMPLEKRLELEARTRGRELLAYQRRLALEQREAEERRAYRRRVAEAAGEELEA